jgi:hypothetical protein
MVVPGPLLEIIHLNQRVDHRNGAARIGVGDHPIPPCRVQGETLAKKISRLVGSVPNVFPTPVQVMPAVLASETIPL